VRLTSTLGAVALAFTACSPGESAPPRNAAEALLTKYTWPGLDGAEKATWEPRDQCGKLDGSYAFRMKLADAVLARDEDALLALVSPFVKLGFGGDYGHEGLKRQLREGGLWYELEKLLPLGCAPHSSAGFTMPWYFAQDMDEADPFVAYIVTGKKVALRKTPSGDGELLEELDWALVACHQDRDAENGYVPVHHSDGRTGYVEETSLRSVIDYRLLAERQEEGWQVTFIGAGD